MRALLAIIVLFAPLLAAHTAAAQEATPEVYTEILPVFGFEEPCDYSTVIVFTDEPYNPDHIAECESSNPALQQLQKVVFDCGDSTGYVNVFGDSGFSSFITVTVKIPCRFGQPNDWEQTVCSDLVGNVAYVNTPIYGDVRATVDCGVQS